LHKSQHRKISLKQCDFIGLWKMGYLDKLDDGNRVELLFDKIQRKEFDEDTCARMFACIGSAKFFKDFINSIIFQIGFAAVGRFEMFLCLPPPIFIVSFTDVNLIMFTYFLFCFSNLLLRR